MHFGLPLGTPWPPFGPQCGPESPGDSQRGDIGLLLASKNVPKFKMQLHLAFWYNLGWFRHRFGFTFWVILTCFGFFSAPICARSRAWSVVLCFPCALFLPVSCWVYFGHSLCPPMKGLTGRAPHVNPNSGVWRGCPGLLSLLSLLFIAWTRRF